MRTPQRIHGRDAAGALTLGAPFGLVAVAVTHEKTARIDAAVRRRHRHPRRGLRHALSRGVKVAAKPWAQLPVAAAVSYGLRRCGVPRASAIAVAAAGAFLADKACKTLVRRDRPPGYRGKEEDESFPSGHTAATAALTLTVGEVLERAGVIRAPRGSVGALLFTLLVAETRLVLDEHWPSDLLAGALLGSAVALGALALNEQRTGSQRASPRCSGMVP